ncbi:MAG TPA: histidine phosphatase family protein [Candidatus Acidoferrum sp.]|nr:histidine phosphatase family protein [Candidatus Acidoferrum sp.]
MELFLVRHGETAWNAERRFQGQSDVPLSERGRLQAATIASALRSIPFTHAYASDLQRATETAQAVVAGRSLSVQADTRLREFDFGAWEGLTWAQIIERWPEFDQRLPTQPRRYEPVGGERFEHVIARVRAFLDELVANVTGGYALIVTHAGALHAAMEVLAPEGFDPLGMVFSTAGISRIAMEDGRARIITQNDVSHLDSLT